MSEPTGVVLDDHGVRDLVPDSRLGWRAADELQAPASSSDDSG